MLKVSAKHRLYTGHFCSRKLLLMLLLSIAVGVGSAEAGKGKRPVAKSQKVIANSQKSAAPKRQSRASSRVSTGSGRRTKLSAAKVRSTGSSLRSINASRLNVSRKQSRQLTNSMRSISRGIRHRADNRTYAGVRGASKHLKREGYSRDDRKRIIGSFQSGTIGVGRASRNAYYMRYHDGTRAHPKGSYLFKTFPASRSSLALHNRWNAVTRVSQWQVRPGSVFIHGRAAAQGGLPGGQRQIFLSRSRHRLLTPQQ